MRAEGRLASFRETLLSCTVQVFGNVAVAFAACEMLENDSTVTRDVSAIVLVRDPAGWRIAAAGLGYGNRRESHTGRATALNCGIFPRAVSL